jgi:hypothetical protein
MIDGFVVIGLGAVLAVVVLAGVLALRGHVRFL